MFTYNWIEISWYELLEDWRYKLTWENGWFYIVLEEEIIDNI